jgi:hypothetical protein
MAADEWVEGTQTLLDHWKGEAAGRRMNAHQRSGGSVSVVTAGGPGPVGGGGGGASYRPDYDRGFAAGLEHASSELRALREKLALQ